MVPIIEWNDENYKLHLADLYIFGSKCYIITKAEYKKQLHANLSQSFSFWTVNQK